MRILQVMAGSGNGGAELYSTDVMLSLHELGVDQCVAMREDALVSPFRCGSRQPVQERQHVRRIERSAKCPLHVASKALGFGLLCVHPFLRCSVARRAAQRAFLHFGGSPTFALRFEKSVAHLAAVREHLPG